VTDLQSSARISGAFPGSDLVFGDMAWASSVVLRFRFCSTVAATRDGFSCAEVSLDAEKQGLRETYNEGIYISMYQILIIFGYLAVKSGGGYSHKFLELWASI
jgi:hypothetical protein